MHLNALLKEEEFMFIGKGDVCFDLPEWLLMSLLAILLLGKWQMPFIIYVLALTALIYVDTPVIFNFYIFHTFIYNCLQSEHECHFFPVISSGNVCIQSGVAQSQLTVDKQVIAETVFKGCW